MTAQDAFAIAFDDEVWAMDAIPGMSLNMKTPKPAGSGIPKNPAAAKGMGDQTSTGEGEMMTLAEHDEKNHKGGYKGGRCTWRDKHGMSGMTLEEAMSKGLANKKFPAGDDDEMPADGQPQQPQQPNPMMQEQAVQQMVQNPQAIESAQTQMLAQPEEMETNAGEIPVQTTVQKAIVESLEGAAATGDPRASEALSELKEKVDDGEITPSPQDAAGQPMQPQPEQPKMVITSSDGEINMPLEPNEIEIIQKDPSKKETYQKILDLASAYQKSKDEEEKHDLEQQALILKRMFYGTDKPQNEQPQPSENAGTFPARTQNLAEGYSIGNKDADGIVDVLDKDGKVVGRIKPDGSREIIGTALRDGKPIETIGTLRENIRAPWEKSESATPSEENSSSGDGSTPPLSGTPPPPPPNTPPSDTPEETPEETPKGETPEEKAPEEPEEGKGNGEQRAESPAPRDEEFQVGKNEYKIGGMTYVDVSGKGLLRTALSSFMAGLQGKGIITGWDKINGTWDQMKRSEKGEMVRDGITSALLRDTVSKYSDKEGLSDDAKMEISVIKDMMDKADTPEAHMKAVKHFQKWKDTYSKELGELDAPKSGEAFKPLPNDYKGKKPPLSILDKPKGFEADKEFGDKTAAAVQERLSILGFPVDELESVNVGPSATTIHFKIPPTFDMSSAKSAKTKESLKGAVGTDISSVEYAKGKKDVLAVTITNPEMRTVGFSDMMASKNWQDFSKKAALPIALGRDASGEEALLDAATMPQTIVTGATGSGKSVFISSAINSIEMAKTPDEARIVLLDPKNEFKVQDGSPHLLFPRAGGDPDKGKASKDMADVLDSLVAIMNDRVTKIGGVVEGFDPTKNEFKGAADHSIKEYNDAHPEDKMPHIMLVFDEIANARDNAKPEDKTRIDLALQKLTAVGRSVGVNCLLATQRDDVGSIPGIIQANCPGRVTFKASPTDAKASQEAKSLAGNGDYILTDKGGNKKRGRGCFISKKEESAIPSYYRDHMEGSPEEEAPTEAPLPEEQTNAIKDAISKNSPFSMAAVEGYEEAFKNAVPEGWSISDEEVDGEKHWKATPPKKETTTSGTGKQKAKDKGLDLSSRQGILDAAVAIRDEAIAEAMEKYKKDHNLKKFNEARSKAKSEYEEALATADDMYPDEQDADTTLAGAPEDEEHEESKGGSESEDDELSGYFNNAKELLADAREGLKGLAESNKQKVKSGKMTNREARAQYQTALQRYNAAAAKLKAGGSYDEVLSELEPEEETPAPQKGAEAVKPAESGSEAAAAESAVDKDAAAAEEQAKKDQQLRSTVPPPKFYTGGSAVHSDKAAKMLTPKEQKQYKETIVPPGWDFVTSNTFNSPAQTEGGKVFVQHPTNGSWGYLYKDAKTGNMKLHIETDTTHPEYKGLVKDKKGQWIEPQEVKAARAAWKHEAKYGNKAKAKAAKDRYYHMRYGRDSVALDEAPDNVSIVANAVASALELIKGE